MRLPPYEIHWSTNVICSIENVHGYTKKKKEEENSIRQSQTGRRRNSIRPRSIHSQSTHLLAIRKALDEQSRKERTKAKVQPRIDFSGCTVDIVIDVFKFDQSVCWLSTCHVFNLLKGERCGAGVCCVHFMVHHRVSSPSSNISLRARLIAVKIHFGCKLTHKIFVVLCEIIL